ncbi:unnamed protein product [Paramecium pentaurelia]|uniref:N-end rule aminoacyl transferase C-terminal domain-containing protein n=1 Tax=Paramecium pentaurelia TaxID=43138 RepID=A0A8S1X2X4_9CILI|nr:unnamed protein product [Paramecium pentaurelia]
MGIISYNKQIKKGQSVNCKFDLHPSIYFKKLNLYQCNCIFECGQKIMIRYLDDYSKLTIQTHQRLYERFFTRNGDFYMKINKTDCCTIYNMRIVLEKCLPTKKQMKSAYSLLEHLSLYDEGNDQKIKQQVQKQSIIQKDFQQQILENQQKQIKKYNQIHNQQKIKLYQIIDASIQKCKQSFEELTQIVNLNFTLKENDVKIFQHQTKTKFYSNANLLLFHQNQQIFKTQKYSLDKFNEFLGATLRKLNQEVNEFTVLQKTKGFLTLIDTKELIENLNCQKQGLVIQQQQSIKQIQKQSKKQSIFKNKSLINHETFTFQTFQVGPIVITIKDLEQSRDIVDFIFQYHNVVHNRNDNDEEIIRLYCRNYLNTNTYLEDLKQNIKIQLGQRFMEYKVNGKLIGLGAIVLTQEYFISEYFFYLPELKNFNFGVFSILVELEYAKMIQKYFPNFKYHTLGYTTFSTKKMEYKLQFSGIEIQCPNKYLWAEYDDQVKSQMKQKNFNIPIPIQIQPLDFSKVTIQLQDMKIKANLLCDDAQQDEISNDLKQYAQEYGNEIMYDFIFIYNEEIYRGIQQN